MTSRVRVFGGAQVPFVLREGIDEKYQLIGEAYADGIIDSEAVVNKEISRRY